MNKKILLNPGPASTTESVRMSMMNPDICPRVTEFGLEIKKVREELINIFANESYTSTLFSGSGTASVESVISSVIVDNGKLLIVNNGSYGNRIIEIAKTYNLNVIEFKSSDKLPIDYSEIEDLLEKNTDIKYAAIVHSETSSGLLNDINKFYSITSKYKIISIVDAMSSLGAIKIDLDKYKLDYICGSANKNIQGMPGISFVISRKKSLEKLKNKNSKSYYLDLYSENSFQEKNNQTRFTPVISSIYALNQALKELSEEGINKRYKRYSDNWEYLMQGLLKLNIEPLFETKYQSKIITLYKLPENISFKELSEFMYKNNITIYPSKNQNDNCFRLSTIGNLEIGDIKYVLKIFNEYFKNR